MFHQLPTELYVYAIQTAAYQHKVSDRLSIVSLAMCSHMIYDIVAPILYHTLVVTDRNADRLDSFVYNVATRPLAKRIIFHVRAYHNCSGRQYPIDLQLLVNLESVTAYSKGFISLSRAPPKLKTVHLIDTDFSRALFRLTPAACPSSDVSRTATHVSGHLPVSSYNRNWTSFFSDPAGWTESLLKQLPVVTHFGLVHELPRNDDFNGSTAQFDCAAVGIAIRTALQNRPRLQCFAIRICGILCETRRAELETVLRDVGDKRIKVWFDMRPLEDSGDECTLGRLDMEEGRSLWTEARPL